MKADEASFKVHVDLKFKNGCSLLMNVRLMMKHLAVGKKLITTEEIDDGDRRRKVGRL